jgi:hypothetical protein
MSKLAPYLLRYFSRYARYVGRTPWLALAVLTVITGGALLAAATHLRLDPRFDALLPDGTPSVEARREARRRMGSSDLYLIAVKSPDPVANYRFARDAAARIAKWKETDWVLHRRDAEVFRRHALLYADEADLKELATVLARVIERAEKRAKRKATGFIELDDEYQAEQKKKDARDRERLKALARKYRSQIKGKREGSLYDKHPELQDALINPRGTVAVALARLEKGTNDVEFSRRVFVKGQRLIERLDPAKYHPEMVAKVAGAYRSFKEYDQALSDIQAASVASLVMVFGLLVVFFRRVRAVIVVLVPLLTGIAWAAGFAALAFGTMNIITSFIVAILIGLGIDFAIHLYAAYRAARQGGAELADGLERAVMEAGPGMFTAALTTMAALLTLTLAHFRAFQEFGLIAAGGVLLCLLAALLVLPPVVTALNRIRGERFAVQDRGERQWPRRRIRRLALAAGALALAATALLAWRAPRIAFEYDFKKLRGKGVAKTGISYGSAMQGSRGTSPMVLLGDSPAHVRAAHEELTRRQRLEQRCCDQYLAGKKPTGKWCEKMGFDDPRVVQMVYHRKLRRHCEDRTSPDCKPKRVKDCTPRVRDLVTVATFIPPHQRAKLKHIAKIRETLRPTRSTDPVLDAPKDLREDLEELRRYARVDAPLTPDDLPAWARRTLTEKRTGPDGKPRVGAVGFLYHGLHFRDARDMMRMADDYAQIQVGERPVRLASSNFVVADVVSTVQQDGRRVFLYAGIAVLLLLLLDLLSFSGALMCFVTLALGFGWALGLMQWLGLKLGVYNMLVVPTALGIGIDGSVHLYHRYRRLGADYARAPLGHTGMAVIASAVTTAAGFAGLFFIQHGGLRTIAQFATLGICLILAAILTILPGLLIWRARAHRDAP